MLKLKLLEEKQESLTFLKLISKNDKEVDRLNDRLEDLSIEISKEQLRISEERRDYRIFIQNMHKTYWIKK